MAIIRMYIYILIIILLVYFTGCGRTERKSVYFKNNSFVVEVARTGEQQEKGLMFRRSLPSNAGMLFIFKDEGLKPFHMKNTYIPLDIIWMDKNKRVVAIKRDAEPVKDGYAERICPKKGAMYVLELNAGMAEKTGLKEGDILRF
ncbi:MAG: DUF192 domain-containing protein [Candidatus Omnitrophota bacterium]